MDRVLACLYSCKSEGGRRIKWVEQQRSVYVSSLRYIPLYLSIIPLIIFVRCLERIRLELNGKDSRETSFQVKGFGNLRSRRNLSSLQRGFDFSDAPNEIVTTIVRWIRENRFWCTFGVVIERVRGDPSPRRVDSGREEIKETIDRSPLPTDSLTELEAKQSWKHRLLRLAC